MSVTRQKQFPELVANRTPAAARGDLQVYSISEVDGQISAIDLSAYATTSTLASISGSLNTEINTLEATVIDISGALTTDIENLDLSLTAKIAEDCVQSEGISGAGTTLNGHLIITINGVTYKLATVS